MQKLVTSQNAEGLLHAANETWGACSRKFGVAHASIRLEAEEVSAEKYMILVCKAIGIVYAKASGQQQSDGTSKISLEVLSRSPAANLDGIQTALAHLLLETVPPPLCLISKVCEPKVQQSAVEVFEQSLRAGNIHLAAKLASRFKLPLADRGDPGIDVELLKEAIRMSLEQKTMLSSAVALLMHFKGMCTSYKPVDIMEDIIEQGQIKLAETWAKALGPDVQDQLIRRCVVRGRLKEAWKLVCDWSLQDEHSDVGPMYKQKTFNNLSQKRLWQAAFGLAIDSPHLQKQLITTLILEDEVALARAYCTHFELDVSSFSLNAKELAQARADRQSEYCQLDLSKSAVQFISSPQDLEMARSLLKDACILGIDAEWHPDDHQGRRHAVSFVQVILIDMLSLSQCPLLEVCFRE